jgi:hypothetical protein
MSLYLCVFVSGGEADGVDAGAYSDFNRLRHYIAQHLEGERPGSRFPTLILHSDCEGEWSPGDCAALRAELASIIEVMRGRAAVDFPTGWQLSLAQSPRVAPPNALESFIDADGEALLVRLLGLAETAIQAGEPILFQ